MKRIVIAMVLASGGLVKAADAPTVSDIDKLKTVLLVREFEIAQLKLTAAQTDMNTARDKIVAQLKSLDAAAPGYHFDLNTLTYQPEQEKK